MPSSSPGGCYGCLQRSGISGPVHGASSSAAVFRSLAGMLSGPVALWGFKSLKSFNMRCTASNCWIHVVVLTSLEKLLLKLSCYCMFCDSSSRCCGLGCCV